MKVASPATLARLLEGRLSEHGDPTRVITLEALLESVLPYAVARPLLNLAGKGEYDLAMLGLLGSPDLVQADPAITDAVKRELRQSEPSLVFAGKLRDSVLHLRPGDDSGETQAAEHREPPPEPEVAPAPEPVEAPEPAEAPEFVEMPELAQMPEPPEPVSDQLAEDSGGSSEPDPHVTSSPTAPRCWNCEELLPDRPAVRFCTSCGVSQVDRRCPECGDRVENSWGFCARCGSRLPAP